MEKFEMKRSAGHVLFVYEGRNYVIDTGSPVSFSFEREETLSLNGTAFTLQHGMIGVDRRDIEALVQVPVAGIIGLDTLIVSEKIAFLWNENAVAIGESIITGNAERLPFNYDSLHVTVSMSVNGHTVPMLLDTGAKIDYLDPQYLDRSRQKRVETDYNPYLGKMTVSGYETVYRIGQIEYPTFVYEQPALLGMLIRTLGVSGIVGMNVFAMAGKATVIDFADSMIEIFKD